MLELVVQSERTPLFVNPETVALAAYTGRDRAAVQRHFDELARIGVKPPASWPVIYPVTRDRVTTADNIEVLHGETSGEVEFALIVKAGAWYVAVASDHTDRRYEKVDVAAAKQLVCRVISREVWRIEEVEKHWDELVLNSYTVENGQRILYQSGTTAEIMSVQEIISSASRHCRKPLNEAVIFSGTIPVRGGALRYVSRFEVELVDPVCQRSLRAAYDVMVNDWYVH